MVSYEIRTMNALPPPPTPDCGPSTEVPDDVLGHRNPCTAEQELEINCLNQGTCYTTAFSNYPACECPDNYAGIQCEQLQLPPDIWQNRLGGSLKTEEYVAIGVVITVFIIVILITVFLVLRYRRQSSQRRLRYHMNNNNSDQERPATDSEKEKEHLKPISIEIESNALNSEPQKPTRNSVHVEGMPRVPSARGRLSAVTSLSSDEEDSALMTPPTSPVREVTECVTGV